MQDGGISITGLTIGGAALTAIGGMVGAWIRARHGRTEIANQPVEVEAAPRYVSCEVCAEHRVAMGRRIDAVSPQLASITAKLDAIDSKAEERSRNLHKRLDPLVATIASSKDGLDNHLEDHRKGVFGRGK